MTGTGRVYRRGRIWWVDYSFRGQRYRESAESDRKGDATALLKRRMAEMGSGRFIGPDAERLTVDDMARLMVDDYKNNGRKSLRRARVSIAHIKAFFRGGARAVDITTARINDYIRRRTADGIAPGTIGRELAALKRMFTLAKQANMIATIPHIPHVHVGDNARKGFFERGDLNAVITQLPDYLQPVVRFAALTGWRKSEVLGLTWAQVDFAAGEVRLEPGTTKNGEGRTFPFAALPALDALLHDQLERTRALERKRGTVIPWLFHRNGHRIKNMTRAWDSACDRAGVPDALFHDLRRTAVRNLERAGVPRSVAMKLTGHKTESVYRRYAIADSAALIEGVAKLAALDEGAARKVVPLKRAADG